MADLQVRLLAADAAHGSAALVRLGEGFSAVEDGGDVCLVVATGADPTWLGRVWPADGPVVLVVDPEQLDSPHVGRASQIIWPGAAPGEWRARVRMAARPLDADLREGVRKTIAHDLRSPLAIISGQCEMLRAGIRGDLSEPQDRAVQAIERQTERLESMLDDLRKRLLGSGD